MVIPYITMPTQLAAIVPIIIPTNKVPINLLSSGLIMGSINLTHPRIINTSNNSLTTLKIVDRIDEYGLIRRT
jgi:hypothetical protein